MNHLTRRRFLRQSLGSSVLLAAATTLPRALAQTASPSAQPSFPVRLGGPIFLKTDDPDELAAAHRKIGYSAAYCPNANLNDTARLRAIREGFARHNVAIAEVGRWVNLLDADPEKRAANLKTVTDGLALAEEVGALCCVDIAGSYSKKEWFGPHPDNFSKQFFDAAVENARKIIDSVKPKRAKFAYEMMGWAMPESPDQYLSLVHAIDRPGFAVHLDPCNAVNSPWRFYENTALLNECFDKLGRWIVSCHAKDLVWDVEMNVHFREVRPGAGEMDYTTYLRRLTALPQRPPLMLEHLPNAEEYDKARTHLLEFGRKIGIAFG